MKGDPSLTTRRLKILLGWMLIVFGLMIIGGGILGLDDPEYSVVEDLMLMAIGGVMPVLGGAKLLSGVSTGARLATERRREKLVLGVAHANGWSLSPVDVAASSSLNLAEAQAVLDSMVKNGHAELVLEEENLTYRFPGFEASGDRSHDSAHSAATRDAFGAVELDEHERVTAYFK